MGFIIFIAVVLLIFAFWLGMRAMAITCFKTLDNFLRSMAWNEDERRRFLRGYMIKMGMDPQRFQKKVTKGDKQKTESHPSPRGKRRDLTD